MKVDLSRSSPLLQRFRMRSGDFPRLGLACSSVNAVRFVGGMSEGRT